MSHFGITTNGASHGYTMGSDERDEIALRLPNMDGRDVWAYSIWPFPDGVDFEDVDKEEASSFYVQCAGSAESMTVEIRERTPRGPRHFVLGLAEPTGEADVVIEFDEFAVTVHEEEVFTAPRATQVFHEYISTGTIGRAWHRRLLTHR